jgi:hypothetical protein
MVTTIARAWSRPGDSRGLPQRHAETVAELQQLGGSGVYPVSEAAVDSMRDEIKRLTPKPPAPDPAVRAAANEFHEAVRRYQRMHAELAERRRKLHQLRDSPAHRLLADVPADDPVPNAQQMVDAVFGPQPAKAYTVPGEIVTPGWALASEWRAAALKVQGQVQVLGDQIARADAPLRWESYATAEKAMSLVFSLASRLNAMEERLGYLEQQSTTSNKRRAK